MKLKFEKSDDDNDTIVYMETPEITTWGDALEHFQHFMNGCGFVIPQNDVDFKELCEDAHQEYIDERYQGKNHGKKSK